MQVYRLGDFITNGHAYDTAGHHLYVVCGEGRALYVGKAKRPSARLAEHIRQRSSLGTAIRQHAPGSYEDWTYTLYTLADCLGLVQRVLHPEESYWYERNLHEGRCLDSLIDNAEDALICDLRPELNSMKMLRKPYGS